MPQTVTLIDLGSSTPTNQTGAVDFVRNATSSRQTDLVLSHYHWDHFSLYSPIGNPKLNRLIVPAVPFLGARESLSQFFAIADIASYGYYRILPRTMMMQGILGEARKSLSDNDSDYFEKLLAYLSRAMSKGQSERDKDNHPQREPLPPKNLEELQKSLDKTEKAAKEIADYFSLAFNLLVDDKNFALFLGDCPNRILDQLSPVVGPYAVIKGAHHGTRYGSCLDDVETTIEIFSRGSRTRPIHEGYRKYVTFQTSYSTDRDGDLSIGCN